jgi:hypothetical protein
MTALSDIQGALRGKGPVAPGEQRFVLVGAECRKALAASAGDHCLPTRIGHYEIVEVNTFPGWEIVDRPVLSRFKGGGKHYGG